MGVDRGTVSAILAAGGTLVLAAASFASVRSAERAARSAERALRVSLRPALVGARPSAPEQKLLRSDARLSLTPKRSDEGWLCQTVRHWNLDLPDPRQ